MCSPYPDPVRVGDSGRYSQLWTKGPAGTEPLRYSPSQGTVPNYYTGTRTIPYTVQCTAGTEPLRYSLPQDNYNW